MGSIVQDLQQEALNPQVKTTDLLRKGLFAAKKLGAKEFECWSSKEYQGYTANDKTPDYRMVTGEFVALNPYLGWVPVYCNDVDMAKLMSKRGCGQSIPELESLIDGQRDDKIFAMAYPKKVEADILKSIDPLIQPRLHVQKSALIKIVNAVRMIILNWAIELEQDGILGDSLSFSKKEKQLATGVPQTINNFYGPIGVSQIQQHSAYSAQVVVNADLNIEKIQAFIAAVESAFDKLKLDADGQQELKSEIETIKSQLASPKPKKPIISESLQSIRRIMESVTGGLGLQLLKDYFGW
ncbi:AbiTii domain-containing protein [Candidatus Nitrospira bockiana]